MTVCRLEPAKSEARDLAVPSRSANPYGREAPGLVADLLIEPFVGQLQRYCRAIL
jgi:hypothetical protein